MKARFQADADLDGRIIRGLKRVAPELDMRTAPAHFHRFIDNRDSPGVILLRGRITIADAIEDLVLIWSAGQADELVNRLVWIPL